MKAWVDGALVDLAQARVSILDHGLLVGDGVFETLRVYRGTPFAWTRHLERLYTSARGLGIEPPDAALLRAAASDVLAANALVEGRLRITVTAGIAPPGSGRGNAPPTAFVVAFPIEPAATRIDVVTVPWTRNEKGAIAGLKTISYAANVRALAYAHERDAGEAIFANTQGNLCEATGSNVFVVRDGALLTPPASAGRAGRTSALAARRWFVRRRCGDQLPVFPRGSGCRHHRSRAGVTTGWAVCRVLTEPVERPGTAGHRSQLGDREQL